MKKEVEIHEHRLCVDLDLVFRSMPQEQQDQFIHNLALQRNIIDKVVDYICGEDSFGSWTSEEPDLRQKLLDRVESKHVEDLASVGPRYGWRVWSDIQQRLKDIRAKQHVYWALSKDKYFEDQLGWDAVHKFFKRHDIESDYTTKQADADIAEVKQMIQTAMRDFNKP